MEVTLEGKELECKDMVVHLDLVLLWVAMVELDLAALEQASEMIYHLNEASLHHMEVVAMVERANSVIA